LASSSSALHSTTENSLATAASSTPRATDVKKTFSMSEMINSQRLVRRHRSLRVR
jgi:hypothetical protein